MKKWALYLLFILTAFKIHAQNKSITLDAVFREDKFKAEFKSIIPMNNPKFYAAYYTDPITHRSFLFSCDYNSGKIQDTLLRLNNFAYNGKIIKPQAYKFSPDNDEKILIATDVEPVYRNSTKEYNYILDRKTQILKPLSINGKQKYADFSPDGSMIAFVRDNNIFLKNLSNNQEFQITSDGKKDSVINGSGDWVYEEEFALAKAFFWSPDGKKIAYYRFDESMVKEVRIPVYGSLDTEEYKYKYPKAGEKNAEPDIYIYDIALNKSIKASLGWNKDQYIPRIKWTRNPNKLSAMRLNRWQNNLEYLFIDTESGNAKVFHQETDKAYIDINDDLTFLEDGKSFIISSEKDGFRHLYLYDINGNLKRRLTRGNWEVTDFYGVDKKNKLIYYQSNEESVLQKNIYSINLKGNNKKKLTHEKGTNEAFFNSDFSYFIHAYSTANKPYIINIKDGNGKRNRIFRDNEVLLNNLKDYKYLSKEFITITTSDNTVLNAWIIKPGNFDSTAKYPVLMYAYGGPGSQMVLDKWNYRDLWFNILANKGYIIVCVDNRGTGGRGAAFKKTTYLNLGEKEIQDQIEAAQIIGSWPYTDIGRIGFYGWSFGGYMASLAITKGSSVFKTAIAGAPVISWLYYDSIYTERYMGTPDHNALGYDNSSPLKYINSFKGNFLLIHGTGDDNVLLQNSMAMSSALIKKNKQFETFYYPNERHGVSSSFHLYTLMTNFIKNNL